MTNSSARYRKERLWELATKRTANIHIDHTDTYTDTQLHRALSLEFAHRAYTYDTPPVSCQHHQRIQRLPPFLSGHHRPPNCKLHYKIKYQKRQAADRRNSTKHHRHVLRTTGACTTLMFRDSGGHNVFNVPPERWSQQQVHTPTLKAQTK